MDLEGQQSHPRDGFSTGTRRRGQRGLLSNPSAHPICCIQPPHEQSQHALHPVQRLH